MPRNNDGEIADFRLLPLSEVERLLAETTDFKFNVGLVIIDFLIRQSYLTPDRADYCDLALGLSSKP